MINRNFKKTETLTMTDYRKVSALANSYDHSADNDFLTLLLTAIKHSNVKCLPRFFFHLLWSR